MAQFVAGFRALCQRNVHTWGAGNRVAFDGSKEEFAIISLHDSYGEVFKLLGLLVDPKLTMTAEVARIKGKARPKIKAILRTRRYYSLADMVAQFKTHVLCLLEGTIGGIFHAASSHLNELDGLQRHFVHELGISEGDAFMHYNLAPLKLRRNIAVLGLIHRCVLGHAHPALIALFPRTELAAEPRTRLAQRRHTRQVLDRRDGSHKAVLHRSILRMAKVYNLLPQRAVDAPTVKCLQRCMTDMARGVCARGGCVDGLFDARAPTYTALPPELA